MRVRLPSISYSAPETRSSSAEWASSYPLNIARFFLCWFWHFMSSYSNSLREGKEKCDWWHSRGGHAKKGRSGSPQGKRREGGKARRCLCIAQLRFMSTHLQRLTGGCSDWRPSLERGEITYCRLYRLSSNPLPHVLLLTLLLRIWEQCILLGARSHATLSYFRINLNQSKVCADTMFLPCHDWT